MTVIHRGDIWWVNLDPVIGVEIGKMRPAVVVSNDISNQCSGMLTVAPVTDRGSKVYPFEVEIPARLGGLTKASKVKCQQIRSIDRVRLVRFSGVLPDAVVHSIERALCLHLGFDPSTHV